MPMTASVREVLFAAPPREESTRPQSREELREEPREEPVHEQSILSHGGDGSVPSGSVYSEETPSPALDRGASPATRSNLPARAPHPSFAASLLEAEGNPRALARRAATGAALAATFGLALGAREGGASLLVHAVGVPAALLAVALLGLPALYIVLALFDAPLSVSRASAAAARGIASAGLVLAGLAPLTALYVVTSSTDDAAALAGSIGLALGGGLGLRHLVLTLRDALSEADSATRLLASAAQLGFTAFALLLSWRVWSALLPLVGGV